MESDNGKIGCPLMSSRYFRDVISSKMRPSSKDASMHFFIYVSPKICLVLIL